jgi:hypothetical protein
MADDMKFAPPSWSASAIASAATSPMVYSPETFRELPYPRISTKA